MQKAFQNHINSSFPFLKKAKLLLAVSGGVDSVVLVHLCSNAKLNIALAHCNFGLRGEESEADEEFVLELGESLNVEVFTQLFDTQAYAKENKLSIQMAARQLRYDWFEDLSNQLKFDYILTAHHADDNLETFLINLSRGTGLEGLTGIPLVHGKVVRPLLSFSRDDIKGFAKENSLQWREDSSNALTKYLRNKLRHDVVPVLKEINPQFLESFQKTQQHLQQSSRIIEDGIDAVKSRLIIHEDQNQIVFSVNELKKLKHFKAYLYQLLNEYGFTAWDDVYDLVDSQSGKQVFSSTHRLLKNREELILTINSEQEGSLEFSVDESLKEIHIPIGVLTIENIDIVGIHENNNIFLDKDMLKFPLHVRQWQKGDYFYPFGMKGKKKLSKFFKDEKFSLIEKEQTWLLCSENEIVWVINHRADDRFKITEKTTNILKITVKQ
ncbi:tRNA lysidine(34) synthetase TilS [Mangrovimonas aestuarii]|uniref:tRNA lysidine(34) synthetase TilS n=1 Tax=Mangrovimonas aestuarii TaxID=3018443 RepID=UPI00237844BC